MRRRRRSERHRINTLPRGLCVLTALIACVVLAPSRASAGPARYVYGVCDSALPGGGTPGAQFTANPGVAFSASNTCAVGGGSLSITETGHVDSTFSFWNVPVGRPPGGWVESIALSGQACCAGPGTKAFVYEQGWPVMNAGETQRVIHFTESEGRFVNGLWVYLGCDGNYAPGCEASPSVSVHDIAATEVDPVAPSVGALGGSLLAGGVVRGHQTLSADASDLGGGLSKVTASVNGLPAGQPNIANCGVAQTKAPTVLSTVAVSPTPCPATLKSSWTLDTAAYPFQNGANSVQVCASDFSTLNEPNTACSAPKSIDVDDSCAESSVTGGEVLSAQFARSHDEEITVPFDHAAKVRGELANEAGDAISGATICVEAQTLGSHRGLKPVATTTTDVHGHFIYKVPPGPNRRLMLGYRHDTFQVARSVRYYAHARPTLRIRPTEVRSGGLIRLSGRVPRPRAAGRVLVLQASALHSSRWYTFDRATANRHGFFRSHYRFDATTRATIYRIRVLVPRQHDYPWEPGHSKPVLVRVRMG